MSDAATVRVHTSSEFLSAVMDQILLAPVKYCNHI